MDIDPSMLFDSCNLKYNESKLSISGSPAYPLNIEARCVVGGDVFTAAKTPQLPPLSPVVTCLLLKAAATGGHTLDLGLAFEPKVLPPATRSTLEKRLGTRNAVPVLNIIQQAENSW